MTITYDTPATRAMLDTIAATVPSRSDRYLARVDEQIRGMTRAQTIRFLDGQERRWAQLQAQFRATEGDSHPGATQFDFSETLDGLAMRIARARGLR